MNIFFFVGVVDFFRSLHVAITCQLIHRAATPTCRSRRCNINRRRHQQQQVAGRFSAPLTLVHTHLKKYAQEMKTKIYNATRTKYEREKS